MKLKKRKMEKDTKKLPVVTGKYDFTPSFVFGKDGPISKGLSDYQVRQQQITLTECIQKAFSEKKHLIAEAATGTGKSFANLVAAFETSIATNSPVVISTHTISLQEQLQEKDVPFLLSQLGLTKLKATLAKGRGNYVSIRRANIAIKEKLPGYTKLNEWLENTTDGTRSDLPFKPAPLLWARARSDSEQCLGENCSNYRQCFFQRSRSKLTESHVIITNHNLVLLDRKLKASGLKGVLPEYKYLILDEAHEVENVARNVLTFEFKQKDLTHILFEVWNDKGTGFLNAMWADSVQDILGSSMLNKKSDELVKLMVKHIQDLLDENEKFFRSVTKFLDNKQLKRFTEKDPFKTDILERFNAVIESLKILTPTLDSKDSKMAVEYAIKKCNEIAVGITEILTLPNLPGKDYTNTAAWATYATLPNKKKVYSVVSSPIFLKAELRRLLFKPLDSVILTSATLASGGNDPFKMLRSTLGVDQPMQLRLSPVFDYPNQAMVVIVTDLPEQKEPSYVEDLAKQVKKFVKVSKGGAFVLFTSFKVMNEVHKLTADSMAFMGCKVFIQGKDLSRNQMIEAFKKTSKGVLFGVSSFWTGVDIPGDTLRNIIITKLPFPSPADPLMQAQDEIFKKFKKNFFMERSVPITAIMLKQGFGRLIRKSTDKGLVVLLDSRVVTKRYGKLLLSALPQCPVKRVKADA